MRKINFEGTSTEPPKMSERAELVWQNYSRAGWVCVHPYDGTWIVCDEDHNLDHAIIFPDDDAFIHWLELEE